jgi:hypothetical protein
MDGFGEDADKLSALQSHEGEGDEWIVGLVDECASGAVRSAPPSSINPSFPESSNPV